MTTPTLQQVAAFMPHLKPLVRLMAMIDCDEAELLITHDAAPGTRAKSETNPPVMIVVTPRNGQAIMVTADTTAEAFGRLLAELTLSGGLFA